MAGGEQSSVELIAADSFSYSLAEGEVTKIVLQEPGFVYAPVVQGQDAGFAYVCIDSAAVGKVPLYYGQTVEQQAEPKRSLLQKLFGGE